MIVDITNSWAPTPENINALPDPLRSYIQDIESAMEFAGIADLTRERLQASTGECGVTYGVREAGDFISAR